MKALASLKARCLFNAVYFPTYLESVKFWQFDVIRGLQRTSYYSSVGLLCLRSINLFFKHQQMEDCPKSANQYENSFKVSKEARNGKLGARKANDSLRTWEYWT